MALNFSLASFSISHLSDHMGGGIVIELKRQFLYFFFIRQFSLPYDTTQWGSCLAKVTRNKCRFKHTKIVLFLWNKNLLNNFLRKMCAVLQEQA